MNMTRTVGQVGKVVVWMSIVSIGLTGVVAHYWMPTPIYEAIISGFSDAIYQQELKLASSPIANASHRILGLAFFIIGMLQFNESFRLKKPRLHRWLGWVYIILAFFVIMTATILAKRHAFAGDLERFGVLGANTVFGTMVLMGVYHARQKRYQPHRNFMIRGYASALFVAFHRPYFLSALLFLDLPEPVLFMLSGGLAFAFCMGCAEFWIWLSRQSSNDFNTVQEQIGI